MTAREQRAMQAEAMRSWGPVDKSRFNDEWMSKPDKDAHVYSAQRYKAKKKRQQNADV